MATRLNPAHSAVTSKAWSFAQRVLKPVIRILLRMGFSTEQISQMVRKLSVDVAMEHPEFRPPNRKRAFIAHAAVVTGLSRKEVAKLHELDDLREALASAALNRAVRVLGGWVSDSRYRDPHTGRPLRSLPLKVAKGVSFWQLAREYGGDVPPRSVLDALIQQGAVSRSGQQVELVEPYPAPAHGSDEELEIVGFMLGDVLDTAEYGLRPQSSAPRRMFREWYQPYVPADRVDEARRIIRDETIALGFALEERLASLSHREPKANCSYRRVGLGAYYFDRPSPLPGDYPAPGERQLLPTESGR